MNQLAMAEIVEAWIENLSANKGTEQNQESYWAISQILDWQLEGPYEDLWEFILLVYKRDITQDVLAYLAAGPLEALLVARGTEYIEKIEKIAKKDNKFNWLLGGVWKSSISANVWEKIELIRREVW